MKEIRTKLSKISPSPHTLRTRNFRKKSVSQQKLRMLASELKNLLPGTYPPPPPKKKNKLIFPSPKQFFLVMTTVLNFYYSLIDWHQAIIGLINFMKRL